MASSPVSSPCCGADSRLSRGEARRRAVVQAAIEVFVSHGYSEATLDMIIARAGGSRRTVYEVFGGKEGLFDAVVHEYCTRICTVRNLFDEEGISPRETLALVGKRLLYNLTSAETTRMYRLVIGEMSRFPKLGKTLYTIGPRGGHERLTAYLAQQDRAGRLAVPEPDRSARRFLDLLRSDFLMRAVLLVDAAPSHGEIDAHVDALVDDFLKDLTP